MTAVAALALASAFNLVCSGTATTISGKGKSPQSLPFEEVYRVDLERMRWCKGACAQTLPLFKVTNERITFSLVDTPAGDSLDTSVNRESGQFLSLMVSGNFLHSEDGVCEAAPFTGFPARKF